MAVVMSLHEIDLAQKISDQVVCVKEHRVDRVGTPEEVMTTEYIQELYAMQDGVYDAAYGSVEFPKPTGDVHTMLAQAKALIDACETVYCPCMEFGVCNSYNQELYFYAKKQNKLKNLSE